MADGNGIFSQSGLSEDEAKEVQGYVMQYFSIFLVFAIVAHLLMWMYKPWFRPEDMGMIESLTPVADAVRVFMA